MINELLKQKVWNENSTKILINRLFEYPVDEKCNAVDKVAAELLKRGDKLSLKFAEEILNYAEENFLQVADSDSKTILFYRLGKYYEKQGNFKKAYNYYEKYVSTNTAFEGNHCIMLKALILRDNFTYSEDLKKEYLLSLGEYDLSTKNDRLYEAIGALLIAEHDKDDEKVQRLKNSIIGIVEYDRLFLLDIIFKKDSYPDTLDVPKAVLDFVSTLKPVKEDELIEETSPKEEIKSPETEAKA